MSVLLEEARHASLSRAYLQAFSGIGGPRLDSYLAEQDRMDAPRNCSTGISCGSTCISRGKRCRVKVAPEAAAKLNDLVAAAGGGPASGAKVAADNPPKAAPAAEAKPERGGALARQQQPKEQKRSGPATPEEKYAGKVDNASVAAYAKEKVAQLLNDPQAWDNTVFMQKWMKDNSFGPAVLTDDTKARKAFNSYFKSLLNTRKAELERGYAYFTDKPEDIRKKLEKAKVSKAKNKEKNIVYLTKKLAEAEQAIQDARQFVEETYPRMAAMSDQEKVGYARRSARKQMDIGIKFGMRDLKRDSRAGREVQAIADFLRVEQGGHSRGVADLLGEDSADDKDVIRAELAGKGTAEGALGLEPGKKPSAQALKSAYRKAASKTHPDAGGSPEAFRMTQQAYERLKKKYNYDSLGARIDALFARRGNHSRRAY